MPIAGSFFAPYREATVIGTKQFKTIHMKKGVLLIFLLFVSFGFAYAQTRTITGTVLDETGAGKPGVAVSGKGTQIGTVTDPDGRYELELPDNIATLVFRAVGYNTEEMPINADEINLTMRIAATEIEGVVVTANAVRREKRSVGYSTSSVTGNELTQGGNTSPLNALTGKVAGANITTTSNSPGASSRVVLRGGSSLTGNNQALIVVDGVPINNAGAGTSSISGIGNLSNQVDYGNRGNDINPDDIESITVLKGPAATAQYGSLGANGAIMITTKKGRRRDGPSKTDIEVSSSYELSNILKYPDFQNKYGQGNIYEGIYDDRRENFSWGEEFNGQLRPWGQIIDGQQKVKPYSAIPNNVKDFFDVGQTWNNNVAINGGNQDAAYRLSLGSTNSKLVFPGNKYNRYTVGFNGNAKLSNKFYSSINVNYVNINSQLPGTGQGSASVLDNLYQGPRDIPITELKDLNDKFSSMNYTDTSGVDRYGYYGAYAINPYFTLANYKNENRVDRVYGNFIIGYQPFEWLRIENRFGADMVSDRRFQSVPKYASEPNDPLYEGYPHIDVGRYSEDLYNTNNLFNDLMATFNKDIAKDLNLNVLAGFNYTQFRTRNTYSSTNEEGGLVTPEYYNLSNSNGPVLARNALSLRRKTGLYVDGLLGYKNMLFLELTGRQDASSTIEVDRSYFYYSANAAFVFTELIQGNFRDKIWNFGKFRVAYGSTANDADPYLTQTIYTASIANELGFGSNRFPFGGIGGAYTYGNRLGYPELRQEYTNEFEVGLENAFLNNRITLDFSVYNRVSKDQIVSVPIATSSGFASQVLNVGRSTNTGVELALRVTPVRTTSGFKWDLYGTFTRNRSEVIEIYPGTDQFVLGGFSGMSVVAAVGKPYGTFYTRGFNYVDGDKIVVDSASGLPLVSATSQYFGSYNPDYQASWGTTLSYKGFTLNVLFDTKQGGMFYSRTRDIMAFVGTSKETENRDEQVWANSVYLGSDGQYHTNTTPFVPYQYYTSGSSIRPESENLVNASYVKLREASLTYTFPSKWFNKTYVGGASVSLYGNNLAIWTPESNKYVDPEVNSEGAGNTQGFDFSAQPSIRRYGINVKFTF